MKKPKKQGGQGKTLASHLTRLERLHGDVAALLHATDGQAQAIQARAKQRHDAVNAEIAKLAPVLEKQFPKVEPALARRFGRLLKRRKELAGALLRDRDRAWDQGPTPPV